MVKIVINGKPTAGKDEVVKIAKLLTFYNVYTISTVDKVKWAARLLGWDGEKTPENRKLLSDLKDLSTVLFDGPFQYIKRRLGDFEDNSIVFIHSREPEEIERFQNELGCYTLFIDREVDEALSNHADKNVGNFNYDFIINNNGSLCDLQVSVGNFFKQLEEKIDEADKKVKQKQGCD